MKINKQLLCIGDLHLGVGKSSSIFFDTALKYADWIRDICIKNNIKTIVQLGDIFHHQYVLCVGTLNSAYQFFDKLKEFDIRIVLGNHDLPKKGHVEENSLKLLSEWPNISVYEKVHTEDGITFCGWGTKIADIPDYQKIIFGHFDIRGFEMSAGKLAEHGLSGSELMSKCDLLMTGHYHKPQIRLYNKKPLIYAGSCYQLNWGESGEDKFAYILNTETLRIEKIENTVSPKFVHIKSEKDYSKIENNFVSIETTIENAKDVIQNMLVNKALGVKTIDKAIKHDVSELNELKEFKGVRFDELVDEYLSVITDLTQEEKLIVAQLSNSFYNDS